MLEGFSRLVLDDENVSKILYVRNREEYCDFRQKTRGRNHSLLLRSAPRKTNSEDKGGSSDFGWASVKIYQKETENLNDPQPSSRAKLRKVWALIMRGNGGGHLQEEGKTERLCYLEA